MRRFSRDELDVKDMESHFECASLAPAKAIWDQALHDGSVVPCPQCGVAGMKNNACTHMTCPKCRTEFCYVCGISVQKLDKAKVEGGVDNIFLHNQDWKTNNKRCPGWLDEIHQVDARWPKDDSDGCVTLFHQIRTKQKLKEAMTRISRTDFEALCRKYNIHQNCGFDLKEISKSQHIMIKRKKSKKWWEWF